jgi:DNA primase
MEAKTQALNELSALLALIGDPIRLDHCIREVADRSGVSEGAIRKKLSQLGKRRQTRTPNREKPVQPRLVIPEAVTGLLVVSLLDPSLAKKAVSEDVSEFIEEGHIRELIVQILEAGAAHPEGQAPNPAKYLALVENSELSAAITSLILLYEERTQEELLDIYSDLVRQLHLASYDRRIRELKQELKKLEKEPDPIKKATLYKEKMELEIAKKEISDDFHRS